MTRIRLLFFSVAVASAASAQVPADVADRIKQEGSQNSQVMQFLDHLTNQIGHRLTGSENYTRACEWTRAQFEEMGLEATLEQWGTWRTGWNRGQWSGRVVSPVSMELHVATPAWTAGTKGVVRGRLLAMPGSREALDELGDRVRGAFLFDLSSIPDYEAQERRARESEAGEGRRRRGRRGGGGGGIPAWLTQAAPEIGIAGLVQSSRGTPEYKNRIRVFADRRSQPWLARTRPTVPEIVVRYDQAERLRWLLSHGDVEVEFDIRNRFYGPVDLHNVVADLKGTEKPDEYVIVCGHLDSWHQATGTTDNGTGTTSTMEAARILAAVGAKPRRTIRFVLWGGEEQGLLGSREHVRRHRTEMDKVSCVLNHDTGTNWANGLTVTTTMQPLFEQILAPVMTMTAPDPDHEGPVFNLRAVEQMRGGGGSDHASFAAAGVPGLSWRLTGRSDYFNHTWHTQWDTYDNAIGEYQSHTATVIALTALGIANLPELLPRDGVVRGGGGFDATAMLSGRLGVEFDGLKFKSVEKDGIADQVGIRAGDAITAVNGSKVQNVGEIFGVLRESGGFSRPVALTLVRDDAELQVEIASLLGNRGQGRGRRRGTDGTADRGRGRDDGR